MKATRSYANIQIQSVMTAISPQYILPDRPDGYNRRGRWSSIHSRVDDVDAKTVGNGNSMQATAMGVVSRWKQVEARSAYTERLYVA